MGIQKVRKEGEDFWRNLVDWCDAIPPGSNKEEDFESALLENVKLKYNAHQSQSMRPFSLFVNLGLI